MNIINLKNKSCFVFPYSRSSSVLKDYLIKNNLFVNGYVDNCKVAADIYNLKNVSKFNFDYIFILSENHFEAIYKQLIQSNIDSTKIILAKYDKLTSQYNFIIDINEYIKNNNQNSNDLKSYFNKKLPSYELKNNILLIGIGFIDLNLKYLYLYIKEHTKLNIYMSTDNIRDIEIFKSYDIEVIHTNSKKFLDLVFSCKIKVVDHSPVDTFLIKCLKIGKIVQLWHGVTVKMLGTQTNYKVIKYDLILSTSQFVTDYSFSKLYDYNEVVHCSYPRNDVLHFDDIDYINIDNHLLNKMKNDNYRYVIYMPTYRPLGFESNPIDYLELEKFGYIHKIKFIIKMHPFSAEKVSDDLSDYQLIEEYKNIIIYPANKDIYPLFKYSDMMVADYSSVYFDYMYVDKPIVFFPYDYEDWSKSADGTMLDYFQFSPGVKCYTFEELQFNILENLINDNYRKQRKKIFNKMFINQTQKASKLLSNKFKKMMLER